ncbi:Acetyltransferase (GNAT) family protein [Hartmannibacter diazotrophicus]|uniref:Acetyltransferase (GNAT) family protein n=1 Tax=Hartmannibacter diazotrophicus TaxID=1482074 RepID=A0A2C9DAA6_9HYPH|nr:GNAT family N-acetyltransferase [Hartmannibacter diazotrophicus]SON57100.1 Acetyltransferase (GNAT) family protein [Hartmannibacter diazotrophicus]
MNTPKAQFGVASGDDVATIVDWAASEGWNPGLGDAPLFAMVDPEGFLVGRVGGELAASISLVRYSPDFAFLGFYICRPDMRGKGIGKALWDHAFARNHATTIGLDGVVAQQDNYAKSGFALAHRNIRYQGVVTAATPEGPSIAIPETPDLIDAIAAYDAPLFPAPRAAFIRAWASTPGHHARAYVEDGTVRGFGVIRPCRTGHKIGPLFAETSEFAEALFLSLAETAKGEAVVLDPPEPNSAAVALAERYGLAPVFETARMYRGPAPSLDLSRIYGITTFELG